MRTITATRNARRAARRDRLDLQRELSAFTSPAELTDLEAILDTYPDSHTAEIRSIIAGQRLRAA